MSRTLIIAALAGTASGVVFVAPLMEGVLGLLLANFTHYPLFLVGLGLGVSAAATAAVAGTVVASLIGGWIVMISFVLVFALPAVIFTRQALLWRTMPDGSVEWYPPGRLLTVLVGYGIGLFMLSLLLLAGQPGGLEGTMQGAAKDVLGIFQAELSESEMAAAAKSWGSLLPALIIVSWLATIVVNATLAQVTLAWRGRNAQPSLNLTGVELPLGLAFVLAVGMALWMFGAGTLEFVGRTLTLVVATVYAFQGIGFVHQVSRGWSGRGIVLVSFYVIFLGFLGWIGLALVAGIGLADQLIGLRRRLGGSGADEEDE